MVGKSKESAEQSEKRNCIKNGNRLLAGQTSTSQAVVNVPPIWPKDRQTINPTAQHGEGNIRDGQGERQNWGNERRKDGALLGIKERERGNDKADEVGA